MKRVAAWIVVLAIFRAAVDENCRGISWGVDAPGLSISARYSLRF